MVYAMEVLFAIFSAIVAEMTGTIIVSNSLRIEF